ncbi:AMP-binding protein [Streptomyces sp. 1331.2]|uniref:AMP-binding protein n=1 Tax=Streptomyces sp. 1331.2 TaxID=1938835 RepID=UPI000BCC8600|nr:AMP-binding protein [Streptomyces sp. 1331.2]SOB79499.1 Phosphopantetheine attachment site [Streptomyces sp. 1331.2]
MTRKQTAHPGGRPTDAAPPAPDETPVQRFRATAARFGDRLAVHGPSGQWTYRELDAASDELAARIRPMAGPGDRVALWCGHDIAAVAAVLAVLKTGAAYVPLDPQQPKAQPAVLAATAPTLLLTDAAHARAAERAAEGVPVLAIAGDGPGGDLGGGLRGPAFAAQDTAGAPARVRPDGGTESSREVLAQALGFAGRLGLTAEDRVPLVARHALDGSVPELFAALLTGASLHVLNPYAAPPATLLGELARQRATVLHGTADLLRLFLVQLGAGAPVPGLRAVAVSGDGELPDVAGHFPGAELVTVNVAQDAAGTAGGRRSEPAEAEVLLRAHPTVRHAAVLADPQAPPGHRLTGYVTSPGPQGAAPEELLRHLRAALPEYAVPQRIVVLPRLPLDPTGRLDRSRLPAPRAAEAAEPGDAPRTEQERRVAELWCEVLARDTAALPDEFFASGGDSARVMRLLQRVRAEYGVAVSVPAFLAAPTLGTLTRLVAAAAPAPTAPTAPHAPAS